MRAVKLMAAMAVVFVITAFVYAIFIARPYNPNKDPDAYPEPCYERVMYKDRDGTIRELVLIGECKET